MFLCRVCKEPVTEQDMVGYLRENGKYVPHSLEFWHNDMSCGGSLEGQPTDLPIQELQEQLPQMLYSWIYQGVNPEDVGIMAMRCMIPGYDEAYRYYDEALAEGIIEPNLPPPALWPYEVDRILQWLKTRSCEKPVTKQDMVGYLRENGKYISHSLEFWRNNLTCGESLEGQPTDLPIQELQGQLPQMLYSWIYEGVNPEDVGIMAMRCMIPGYDEAYRYYDEALAEGIIEPNLPPPALCSYEVNNILQWLKTRS